MSGIYGYLTSNHQNKKKGLDSLARWNSCYGKKKIEEDFPESGYLGVFSEHFSSKIPEQKEMLKKKGLIAVIDCVLFNREELSSELGLDGALISDESLLFEYILQKGSASLRHVNGDFTGVIWNQDSNTLLLFRDHLGIRPLYYYFDQSQFIFSTDIRGITSIPDLKLTLNQTQFYRKAAGFSCLSRTDTELQEIHYLKAGTVIEFSLSQEIQEISQKEYWTLANHHIHLESKEAYRKRLRQLIEDAVKIRMDVVDGDIGSELSGGLDSSVISILINRLGRSGKYHSWSKDPSIHPIIRDDDERIIIDAICKQEGITCKYMNSDVMIKDTYQYTFDQIFPPFTNTLPISQVSAWMNKEGGRVVFTGHGGDEGVSRRGHLYELWHNREYLPCIKAIYNSKRGKSLPLFRTLKTTVWMVTSARKKYLKPFHTDAHIAEYLNESFRKEMEQKPLPPNFTFAYNPVQYINNGGLRARMDNTAFQAAVYGIRYMYPFLDYRVMEYAVSVPRHLYHDGVTARLLFEETFDDLMPKGMHENHSKEMPSDIPTGDVSKIWIQQMNQSALDHLAMLDPSFWEPYINFEKLRQFRLSENASREEGYAFNMKLVILVSCALLQNMLDNT